MSVADMIAVARADQLRRRPAGRRAAKSAAIPGPHTSLGVFLGIKAAVRARSARTASPACTSRCRARAASPAESRATPRPKARGCRSPTSTPAARRSWPQRNRRHGRRRPTTILGARGRRAQPVRARRDPHRGQHRRAQGADRRRRRQQPARDARRTASGSHARGILYAPDYVINAGGIINVSTEYLGDGDAQPGAPADRGHPRPARSDLGRKRRHRPQPRRGRRRHGAAADRARLTESAGRGSALR